MVHGGSSFGFSSGANSPPYSPQTTSYDYDAPIDEAGRATPKYHALRDVIAKHLLPGETIPPMPAPKHVIAIPPIRLTEAAPLFEHLGSPHRVEQPRPMENFDLAQGCILYRTSLPAGDEGTLRIVEPHDYSQVYLDGRRVAVLDRRHRGNSVKQPARKAPSRLDILVEATGRVNFGGDLHDRKGITQRVEWRARERVAELRGWEVFLLPMDEHWLGALHFGAAKQPAGMPAVYRGTFELAAVGDSFLDMRGWEKGMVWVNGHNLGRFWSIGPQQTLYLPGCWLKTGANEIKVLDITGGARRLEVRGLAKPILDEIPVDPLAPKPLRKPGQTLHLENEKPVFEGRLPNGKDWQTTRFRATLCRYLCLEALDAQNGDAFTTCAEIVPLDVEGRPLFLDRKRVIFADSEELDADDGSATNVLDDDPATFWHTQWQAAQPAHPHQIVIDLGREVVLSGVRCLPRQDSPNGRIGRLRLYVSVRGFTGQN